MSTIFKELLKPVYYSLFPKEKIVFDPKWLDVKDRISRSRSVIDLGCGNNPVEGATHAVDFSISPDQRSFGAGETIDLNKFRDRGISFTNSRIDVPLPFKDKEFDFAYSHHVFEHTDDPSTACREMMRIAKSGVIVTPTISAEIMFGRPYHKWLIIERNNTILFFKKRPDEDSPFGSHPDWNPKKNKWAANKNTNPFDILLNESNWYKGIERMPRLSKLLRKYWFSHSEIMNVIFIWENSFDFKVYNG